MDLTSEWWILLKRHLPFLSIWRSALQRFGVEDACWVLFHSSLPRQIPECSKPLRACSSRSPTTSPNNFNPLRLNGQESKLRQPATLPIRFSALSKVPSYSPKPIVIRPAFPRPSGDFGSHY